MKRPGNNPKRRVAPANSLSPDEKTKLAGRVKYIGSGHHKRNPADYGLERTNPRPTKSLCDAVRIIPLDDAKTLIKTGILHGMVSLATVGTFPKYVWCVGEGGEVYEAKTDAVTSGVYHGYRLEEDDDLRAYIKQVWKERCPQTGP